MLVVPIPYGIPKHKKHYTELNYLGHYYRKSRNIYGAKVLEMRQSGSFIHRKSICVRETTKGGLVYIVFYCHLTPLKVYRIEK